MSKTPDQRPMFYKLNPDTKKPEPVSSLADTAHDDRTVARTFIQLQDPETGQLINAPRILVSTVFLGIDHRFVSEGDPILFETMVFVLPNDDTKNPQYDETAAKDAAESFSEIYITPYSDNEECTILDICERYCTYDEATAGHDAVCKQVEDDLDEKGIGYV